jgi:hypothetical protein
MTRFRVDPFSYCNKKFGVYEVKADQYLEIIQTCKRVMSHNTTTVDATFLGFISIRQPLERTVSAIHQRCNHGRGSTIPSQRNICERCSYSVEEDRFFFDHFVNQTNEIYSGVDALLSDPLLSIPLWFLDNTDITLFFESLEQVATQQMQEAKALPRNETFHFPKSNRTNAQDKVKTKICDFGMTSAMMKNHAGSLKIYRWILERMTLAEITGSN